MSTTYRGTYVVERKLDNGEWEVLLSVSSEMQAPNAYEAHEPLLNAVGKKIERLHPTLLTAEEEPTTLPIEAVPNAPTIKSVTHEKE